MSTRHAYDDRHLALIARLDGDASRILACRGDDEPLVERDERGGLSILSDVEIYAPAGIKAPTRELKAGGGQDANAHRLELIQAVRNGTHLELVVKRALTYRQKKGSPNRRYLRFAADALETIAPTFAKQPFLVDHNTYEQDKRKGTILTSEVDISDRGMSAFYMGFSVVKPESVISVLDGTIDRFSIGWFVTGPVLCSVHRTDVRGMNRCNCWPGDIVEVDGKAQIVEFEYQSAEGKELSAVNVPAVKGTQIEEYRAALAAELHLPPTRKNTMAFAKLAAALALATLTETDEDRAVAYVTGLRARAEGAEVDAAALRAANATLTADNARLTAENGVLGASALDGVIVEAYKTGRLGYGKDAAGKNTPSPLEDLLRAYGKSAGRDALQAKITSMPIAIPVGLRQLTDDVKEPEKTLHAVDPGENPYLASTIEEMNRNLPPDQQLKLEDAQANARRWGGAA